MTAVAHVDLTETFRRIRLAQLNPGADRAVLEHRHGTVWNPTELAAAYKVVRFMAPFVIVRRKADGKIGSLEFQHAPRFYFNWQEDQ
ncbi:MAG: hypothetical protein ACOYOU_17640 [Kiritimatiellia bacterium]